MKRRICLFVKWITLGKVCLGGAALKYVIKMSIEAAVVVVIFLACLIIDKLRENEKVL